MKLAIFDLDGTLVDSLADIAEASNFALRSMGLPEHELSEFNHFVGDGLKTLIERILPENTADRFDEAVKLYNDYYNKNYTVRTYAYEGIEMVLDKLLSFGVTLAVASNKTDIFTQNVIKHYFGENRFTYICGKVEGVPVKPDPTIVEDIISKSGFDKTDCVMIGDTSIDINTGKNAGIKTIGCLWGFRDIDELKNAGADMIAEKPSDLIKLITDL